MGKHDKQMRSQKFVIGGMGVFRRLFGGLRTKPPAAGDWGSGQCRHQSERKEGALAENGGALK